MRHVMANEDVVLERPYQDHLAGRHKRRRNMGCALCFPRNREEWEAWEREHDSKPVARCTGCGRGYVWTVRNPIPCAACGAEVLALRIGVEGNVIRGE
jgi:hypothetical protein